MAQSKISLYDFNSILKVTNLVLCILSIYFYSLHSTNEYVDQFTIFLAVIIALENIVMLFYEKKKRNPFIVILIFVTTLFYLGRITTLVASPFSLTFQKLSINYEDLNYSLIFIILSNASIFLGLYIGKKFTSKIKSVKIRLYSVRKTSNLIIIIFLLGALTFLNIFGLSAGELGAFLILLFLHSEVVLLFTFCYLVYYYDNISKKIFWVIIISIVIYILLVTLSGSRSALLTIFYLLLFSILVVKKRFLISKVYIYISLILFPVSIIFFIYSTFNRDFEVKENNPFVVYTLLKEHDVLTDEKLSLFYNRIYDRIGFLDYSTALVSKPELYEGAINISYYTRSIIDNLLTPGFDIFDTAKASNVIGSLSNHEAIPNKKQAALSYQSDMMGIYGEYYVLFFGYAAIFSFFLTSFTFQCLYDRVGRNDLFLRFLYQSIVLMIYTTWLLSFGTDWIFIELFTSLITCFFIKRFYLSSKIVNQYTNGI